MMRRSYAFGSEKPFEYRSCEMRCLRRGADFAKARKAVSLAISNHFLVLMREQVQKRI